MILYHATTEECVESILKHGFIGGTLLEGEPKVWFCDDVGGAEAYGETIVTIEVPASIAEQHRLIYDDQPDGASPGGQHEYAFPADAINSYPRGVV